MNGSGRYLDENEGATRCVSRVAVLRVAWAWGAGVMVWAPQPLSLCKLAKCRLWIISSVCYKRKFPKSNASHARR